METKKHAVKIKKLPHAQVELSASISVDIFDATRSEAIRHIGVNAELPGFRKGHVPEKMLVTKIGEAAILEEMAEIAIGNAYPEIIREEKLDVLGRPEVRITKIAHGNPLEFTIITAIFPEIILPDYKKLSEKEAAKKDVVVVSDEEVSKTIEQIRSMHARRDSNDGTTPATTNVDTLPPLDDAYVKTLGDFTDVDDFKTKLKANLTQEKERAAKDKKRITIIDAILAKTTLELPEIIIEQELARMEDEFAHDVKRMGLTMENYLKAIQKTNDELRKEQRPIAEKRAKTQLIVGKIAEVEKVEPDAETLKKEVAALRVRYPDAPEDRAESYIRMLLTNEKVFELLESTKS